MNLETKLSELTGIGPSLSYKLSKLNITTVGDLIYHFPFRYDDFSQVVNILEAKIGEKVTLVGEIWSIKNIFTRSKKILTQAIFNDGTSPVELTWFNQSWLTKQIQTGDRLQISGKVSKYKNRLSIIAPTWEKLTTDIPTHRHPDTLIHTGRLVPIYPETSDLSSKWIRTKISQIFPQIKNHIKDPLPDSIRGKMLLLSEALEQIHLPKDWQMAEKSRERLGFDEMFLVQLATQKARQLWQGKKAVKPLKIDQDNLNDFIKGLSFQLTKAQIRVIEQISTDLKKTYPMNRLLQGEVGSGKTVVAATIAYLTHLNGLRTLFMAPTEILAFQHFDTISKLLGPYGITVGIYTGSRKKLSTDIPSIIIGTHALLSDKLVIQDVGLVVIDEQQRFGVEQRSLLRSKAKVPHFLTMTATPIPRTVALTVYGDLDLSVIDELPKNRQKIKTYVVPSKKRADAYGFIQKQIEEGGQAYIITPLIELSETLTSAKAAKVEYERLSKKIFPKLKLGLLHGRIKPKEKEEVMKKFREGRINILVSTSVVEVGMDVHNATVMVIEGAERFGLSQLHQLRGRVGRGSRQSFCLLFTENDLQQNVSRLKNLEKIDNGMLLAELDLKIRGSGEIFGKRQSGRFEFKIASFSDLSLIEKTRKAAQKLLQDNPALDKYPLLQAQLASDQIAPD